MSQSLPAQHEMDGVDGWYFDAKPEIVDAHLSARSVERKVMLGCTLIGLIGVVILLTIVFGSTSPGIGVTALHS